MSTTKVGLYGINGHQIQQHLVEHPHAELVAVAAFPPDGLPDSLKDVRQYQALDNLLEDSDVEMVSLCSPLRRDQAQDAIRALNAGKHVYAEKPCAMTEPELDAIMEATAASGKCFREMAPTILDNPYKQLRAAVQSGAIGEVVQVLAQKCYPWADTRPVDENIDGGLSMQVGVYVARFVEHIAGVRIISMEMQETKLGNTVPGSECRRAASFLMTLDNGGVASGVANYLNPIKQISWGYEILRIFGTKGIVESNTAEKRACLMIDGEAPVDLDLSEPAGDYFDAILASLRGEQEMPLSLEAELSPTRWVIRAKNALGG